MKNEPPTLLYCLEEKQPYQGSGKFAVGRKKRHRRKMTLSYFFKVISVAYLFLFFFYIFIRSSPFLLPGVRDENKKVKSFQVRSHGVFVSFFLRDMKNEKL